MAEAGAGAFPPATLFTRKGLLLSGVFVAHYGRNLCGDTVFVMCKLPSSREGPASERSHHLSGPQLSSRPDGSPQVFLEGHSEAAISSSDFISCLLANIVVWGFFSVFFFFFFFLPAVLDGDRF